MVSLLASLNATVSWSQAAKYPALADYMMSRDSEIALAKSAAPANISSRATIKVLTTSGYQVAQEGDNGFVCLVLRGWAAPTYTPAQFRDLVYDAGVRAPICFNPPGARQVMPYYELRSKLGMEGKTPDQISEYVQAAFAKGQLPRRDEVSFAYMWSADQNLGTGIGHWHPHMMVFAPYYDNSLLGNNEFGGAPAVVRRCRNTVRRGRHSGGRRPGYQDATVKPTAKLGTFLRLGSGAAPLAWSVLPWRQYIPVWGGFVRATGNPAAGVRASESQTFSCGNSSA